MSSTFVTKRDGSREPLDLSKFHRVVAEACEGLSGVSASEVELRSQIKFFDGITTTQIQETLIRAAADLISEESPNYQYVAGRLINYHIRKQIYGDVKPWPLGKIVERNVALGFYEPKLLEWYSEEEFHKMNRMMKHSRDLSFTYAAMEQWRGKYLVQNRYTKQLLETPQVAYVLIAATLFHAEDPARRMEMISQYYDLISEQIISLPTPVMAGVRTPERQFSSCVLVESGDSIDSIFASAHAIGKYVSRKAGIGIGAGSIRAVGSKVRNGDVTSTGAIPFYRHFQSAVRSCSQGGVRNGAATLYYPIWHYEIEDLLVLKNNKGTEDNRIRHMDYGVQISKIFYERLISGGDISLFSPSEVPGLYDAFFRDQDEFRRIYEEAEKNPRYRKKVISAIDLFTSFMEERKNTGRIYLMNVDHANDHGPFDPSVDPIRMSNLCAEIALPTRPFQSIFDENGRIALCTLSAINWGKINDPSEFETACYYAVRALDNLLSYQDYPVLPARLHTEEYRPLGIGIIGFAHFLAKNGVTYQNADGLDLAHRYAEAWSYHLISASVRLAAERGAAPRSPLTRYGKGILPIDTYKREVDELTSPQYSCDWDRLRRDLREHGIRNTTLMALMPSETSSQIANETNGVEPPRALVSVKQSKDGVLKQVVPEIRRLKNRYDLLWDQASPIGYLKYMAVLQKFIDQSISTNTSYNPFYFDDEKIPMSVLLRDLLLCYKYGIKTLYYFNTYDGAGEVAIEPDAPPAVEEIDDASCESCVL
jgi:ribonucleoside-diphosphate reductase alpha chain